jgi:hypothetical protein
MTDGPPSESMGAQRDREIRELAEAQPVDEQQRASLFLQIQRMTVAERIKLAMLGNKEVRGILIRDPTKAVQVSVVQNPRITDSEIERIALSKTTDDEVIRIILNNRDWLKKYFIKVALVHNPRTPLKASMRFLPHLRDRELKTVAQSRNLPNPLVVAARKTLYERQR